MIDISKLARFSSEYMYTRTKNSETGKAADFDEECSKASAEKAGAAEGAEKTEAGTPSKDSGLRTVRMKYTPIFVTKCDGYCVAEFLCDDCTSWDPSEMTEDERLALQEMTGGLPTVCIPPNVVKRMSDDDTYADRIWSQIGQYVKSQGGELKDAKLPLDEDGNIIGLDSRDNLFVKAPEDDDGGKGFWEARAERQEDYIKYCQQKAMEHRIAVSKEFAALSKGGEGLSAEELLAAASGETDGTAGMLLGL